MFDHPGGARCVLENDLMSLTEFVSRPFPVLAKLAFALRNIPAVQFVFAKCAALLRADQAIAEPLARKLLEVAPVIAPDTLEQPAVALQSPGDAVGAEPEREPDETCAALLRGDQAVAEPLARELPEEASGIAPDALEQPAAPLQSPGDVVGAEPEREPDETCAALLRADEAIAEPLARELPEEASGIAVSPIDPPVAVLEACEEIALVAEPEPDEASEREKLIRRRWAETGSKMWNPDFHGAGRAALNIQGRVELLPAKPGEQMPQYDKLEFRQVGDDIVCEGVMVDPPKRRK
jgi:hypothetical protein